MVKVFSMTKVATDTKPEMAHISNFTATDWFWP